MYSAGPELLLSERTFVAIYFFICCRSVFNFQLGRAGMLAPRSQVPFRFLVQLIESCIAVLAVAVDPGPGILGSVYCGPGCDSRAG